MKLFRALALSLTTVFIPSCADNNFKGGVETGKAPAKTGYSSSKDTVSETTSSPTKTVKTTTDAGTQHMTSSFVPAVVRTSVNEGSTKIPLAITFALDVTASMASNISGIQDAIQKLLTNLNNDGFDTSVGLVSFRDEIVSELALTKDVAAFKASLASLVVEGGNDEHEFALGAVVKAVSNNRAQAIRGAVKVVFVFSDNIGHNGGTTLPRDCDAQPLIAHLNAIPAEEQKLTKIFYSTPKNGYECTPYLSPSAQWEAVLSSSLPSADRATRGAALGYPVTPEVVYSQLTDLIKKTTFETTLICLAEKAELKLEGRILDTYVASSAAELYRQSKTGKVIDWTPKIARADLAAAKTSAKLEVTQCRLTKAAAEAGEFASCEKRTAEMPFTIK